MIYAQVDFIWVLIILFAPLIVFLAIFIPIIIINKRYDNFVMQNSKAYNDLLELNKQQTFKDYDDRPFLYFRFDNKGNWSKTNEIDYLARRIRYDLSYWFDLRKTIQYNKGESLKYKEQVEQINVPMSQSFCEENKKRYKKCIKVEKRLFEKAIIVPKTDIVVNVRLRYVSRKGKVDLSKSKEFGFTEINRIIDATSPSRVDRSTYEKLARAERGLVSDSLRYDVMRRDGFKCVLCGLSSKDGVILHVDHIIPVSKGGKTDFNNLRTLCERCNLGKSNKIE